ncbi:hypothetical protein [Arachidicoccus terrestris]|uniref:hypothetical protein n=1 Tax=Arachidicoccus terrestris TaxID=2875539 RepID=UPI001CC3F52E|nr:hypothetical protein [Arachidicoccus terrestris]UAY54790.1 hypothetical protein K9M52_15280 [Arachidicoccus terrestris]
MQSDLGLKQFLDVDFVHSLVRKKYTNCQVQMVESCSFSFNNYLFKDQVNSVFSGKFIYVGYVSVSPASSGGIPVDGWAKPRVNCVEPWLICNGVYFIPNVGSLVPVIFDNVALIMGQEFAFSFIGFRVYVEGSIDNFTPAVFNYTDLFTRLDFSKFCVFGLGDYCGFLIPNNTTTRFDGVVFRSGSFERAALGVPAEQAQFVQLFFPADDLRIGYMNAGYKPGDYGFGRIDLLKDFYFGSDHFSFVVDDSVDSATIVCGNKTISYLKSSGVTTQIVLWSEFSNAVDTSKPIVSVPITFADGKVYLPGSGVVTDFGVAYGSLSFKFSR